MRVQQRSCHAPPAPATAFGGICPEHRDVGVNEDATARPTNYERGGGTAIVAAGGALGRVAAIVAAAGTTGAAMR